MVAEFAEFRDVLGDVAEGRLVAAAGDVDVAAEAADAIDLERVVEFPVLFEGGALGFRKRVEDQPARGFGIEQEILERDEVARDPGRRGGPGGKMEVGAAELDGLAQVVGDFAGLAHGG